MLSDRRLHPYSILFGLGSELRQFLIPGVVVLVTAGTAGGDWQGWTLVFLIPYALSVVARYLSFRYRYEERELVIRTGLIFRNERHIPYARVQNINAVQNVLHRLLNVIEVRIETGGGQEAEARMSVLPVEALEEMRRRVFGDREGPALRGRRDRHRGCTGRCAAQVVTTGSRPERLHRQPRPRGDRSGVRPAL